MQSVQTFGRKVRFFAPVGLTGCVAYSLLQSEDAHCLYHAETSTRMQKNAVAVAYAKRGKGVLRLNGACLSHLLIFHLSGALAGSIWSPESRCQTPQHSWRLQQSRGAQLRYQASGMTLPLAAQAAMLCSDSSSRNRPTAQC